MQVEQDGKVIFIRTWVASDGISTVQFLDQKSAEIYSAETGFPMADMFVVGIPLILKQIEEADPSLYIAEATPWVSELYHPEVSDELTWHDSEQLLLPYLSDVEATNSEEIEQPLSSELVAKIGTASYLLDWPFRDLAASTTEFLNAVLAYVETGLGPNGVELSREEAMQKAFEATGTKRFID